MPNVLNEYPSDGVSTSFEVSMLDGYLNRAYIKFYTRQEEDLLGWVPYDRPVTWVGAFTFTIQEPIPEGQVLVCMRETAPSQIVDFENTSRITPRNLNTAFKQSLHRTVELEDWVNRSTQAQTNAAALAQAAAEEAAESAGDAEQSVLDAVGLVGSANAAAQEAAGFAQDAANSATNAETTADTALALIEAAVKGNVDSFNGRDGIVVPQAGDYTPDMVGFVPNGTLTPVAGWPAVPAWGTSALDAPAQALVDRTEALADADNITLHTAEHGTWPLSEYVQELPQLAESTGSERVYYQLGATSLARTIGDRLRDSVNLTDYALNDGSDQTSGIQAAIDSGKPIFVPAGVYGYTELTGLNRNGLTIFSNCGSANAIFKFLGEGVAFDIGDTSGFTQGYLLNGFTVEGNKDTTEIIRATAMARSKLSDINVREANETIGRGIVLRGCMLNHFDTLTCSQDRQAMTHPPAEAVAIEALAPFGNSSNNTFINLYAEGAGNYPGVASIDIGVRISGGTQNTFIGGSPESCRTWGLLIGGNCQYNTFIGTGFENLNAIGGDFSDGGISNKFINCYASHKVVMQGRSGKIEGGIYERIQIDAGAQRNKIEDVAIKNWGTGSGGFFDSGIGTITTDIWDAATGKFIIDYKPRFLMYLTSPVTAVTGAGAVHVMNWATQYDDAGNCDGTYFAAPIDGRYRLVARLSLLGISTDATLLTLSIVTSGRTYTTEKSINARANGAQEAIEITTDAQMAAGDGAYVTVKIDGMSANLAGIVGNSSIIWSSFSGGLLL